MPVETYGSPTTIITGPTTVGPYSSIWGATTAAAFNKTNDATPATITGLSLTLTAGHTYSFLACLSVTADLVGGWQVGFGGAATATSFVANVRAEDNAGGGGGSSQQVNDAVLANDTVGGIGTANLTVWIYGTIVVNAGGTFGLQFAQDAATPATTSTVNAGSFLWIKDESPGLGGITFAALTPDTIPKAATAATLGDSKLTDDGTTATYAGTGGLNAKSLLLLGIAGAEFYADGLDGAFSRPGEDSPALTLENWANGQTSPILLIQDTGLAPIFSVSPTGLITTAAGLANGTTATTQAANDNSTKLATTAYSDAAAANPVHITLPTGAAGTSGTATVNGVAGVVVNTTAVTASSLILLTYNTPKGGVSGILSAPSASIVAATSFTIFSTDAADITSTVNWILVN